MNKAYLSQFAKSIRSLSIDAINHANSGHPGLPLGCAEIAAYLYGHALRHNPRNPLWLNRDRFVLSAGHGSMLLYSALYLSGYDVSLADIKQFRQWGSKTAGHPEHLELPGIETTTGPLGQGVAMAVGMALAQRRVEKTILVNPDNTPISHTYILAGDGCLMEGITAEASSLAGHLKLDNLIMIYDSNDICLDGPTEECFTENVGQRYQSYGWDVQEIDGHDFDALDKAVSHAKSVQKPALIIAKTTIGYGSPNRSGSSESHGKPLGDSEASLTKSQLGIPLDQPFWTDPDMWAETNARLLELAKIETLDTQTFTQDLPQNQPVDLSHLISEISIRENLATRASSQAVIQSLKEWIPNLLGGSADLSCSDATFIKDSTVLSASNWAGQNIKYGVREFAMAAIANGISIHGVYLPFVGTFLTFSDYMKNAVRLSALMNLRVIYQFTHDSIFLGEDGPTHQPVEQLAALRSIPNLVVIRPADATEVKGAWSFAVNHNGPVALVLSRQSVPDLPTTRVEGVKQGAYIITDYSKSHCFTILATGSEVSLAVECANELNKNGIGTRVVSMPSWEIFDMQPESYQTDIFGDPYKMVAIEAQSFFGWHRYIGKAGIAITIDEFGKSAPQKDLEVKFGFTTEQIVEKLSSVYTSTMVG